MIPEVSFIKINIKNNLARLIKEKENKSTRTLLELKRDNSYR